MDIAVNKDRWILETLRSPMVLLRAEDLQLVGYLSTGQWVLYRAVHTPLRSCNENFVWSFGITLLQLLLLELKLVSLTALYCLGTPIPNSCVTRGTVILFLFFTR